MNKKAIVLILATALLGAFAFYVLTPSKTPSSQTHTASLSATPISKNSTEIDLTKPSAPDATLDHSPINDSTPDQTQDKVSQSSNQRDWRADLVEKLGPLLDEKLRSDGFSQYEIDIATKEIEIEFRKPKGEALYYSEAAFRAAKILNFDEEKKQKLNMTILTSIAQSFEITFDQWDQCLSYRVKSMSPCVQDIAQNLSRKVAEATTGQSIAGDDKSRELSKKAMAEAVKQCGITEDDADRALRIVLSDCP